MFPTQSLLIRFQCISKITFQLLNQALGPAHERGGFDPPFLVLLGHDEDSLHGFDRVPVEPLSSRKESQTQQNENILRGRSGSLAFQDFERREKEKSVIYFIAQKKPSEVADFDGNKALGKPSSFEAPDLGEEVELPVQAPAYVLLFSEPVLQREQEQKM